MLNKILCPTDGSFLGDEILTQVRRILVREDAEVTLLRVLPPQPPAVMREEWETACGGFRTHLEDLANALTAAGARVRCEFRTGDPAGEILRCAESLPYSLIAMSTHGRSGLTRWVRGSVAERVLEHAPCPCLLINPKAVRKEAGADDLRFRRILVPLDGSELAARILPLVEDMARLYGAEVVLLHVAAPVPGLPESDIAKLYTAQDALPAIEPQRAALERAGVKARAVAWTGDPAGEILRISERGDADLVMMMTHGRTGLSRWRYGSVAEKVLRDVRYPVLVVRATEAAKAAQVLVA